MSVANLGYLVETGKAMPGQLCQFMKIFTFSLPTTHRLALEQWRERRLSVLEDILIDYNLVGKEPGSVAVVLVGYHADVTRLAVVYGSVHLEEQGVVAFGNVAMDGGHVVIFAAIFRYIIIYLLRG